MVSYLQWVEEAGKDCAVTVRNSDGRVRSVFAVNGVNEEDPKSKSEAGLEIPPL